MATYELCGGCGLQTEAGDGPRHRYLGASVGCWALFGKLLAREYGHYAYMAVHNLTVDAYALQHPGQENPQTISSANVHLASLYSHFVLGVPVDELAQVKQQLTAHKASFVWLEPPPATAVHAEMAVTVADVLAATDAAAHRERVTAWARAVFTAWRPHHAAAAALLKKVER